MPNVKQLYFHDHSLQMGKSVVPFLPSCPTREKKKKSRKIMKNRNLTSENLYFFFVFFLPIRHGSNENAIAT